MTWRCSGCGQTTAAAHVQSRIMTNDHPEDGENYRHLWQEIVQQYGAAAAVEGCAYAWDVPPEEARAWLMQANVLPAETNP